jgi:hypothetical protein
MNLPFKGGCICGAIRYEGDAEPLMSALCHCRQCQRSSGGAYNPLIVVPKDTIRLTGAPRYREYVADSGNTASDGFCADCGAHILGKTSGMPDMMGIRVASLDDPGSFKPQMHIYTESAQPWDNLDPALPKFGKMPPM